MMEEKNFPNNESDIYSKLLYGAFNYFQEHPIMLVGVGLSVCSSCIILSSCVMIEKKIKGVN